MIYEFTVRDDLSEQDIEYMVKKSTKLKRCWLNFIIFLFATFLGILTLIGFMLGVIFDKSILFYEHLIELSGLYMIIYVFMVLLLRDKFFERFVESVQKNIKKYIKKNQGKKGIVEINANVCKYTCENTKFSFNKKTVIEILKFEKCTLIVVKPRLFKRIIILIIGNNLFGAEEKYNEFINSITK